MSKEHLRLVATNVGDPCIKEKQVSGVYTPRVGITFEPCSDDPDVAEYLEPHCDARTAQLFLNEWQLNIEKYPRKLAEPNQRTRHWMSHKDMALLIAVLVTDYLTNTGFEREVSFALETSEAGFLVTVGSGCHEWRSGDITSFLANDRGPDTATKREQLSIVRKGHRARCRRFSHDFESIARNDVAAFEHLRSGPWPEAESEITVSGRIDRHARIHIDLTDPLLSDINTDPEGRDFPFVEPEGGSASVYHNDSNTEGRAIDRAFCQPVEMCRLVNHLQLAIFGIRAIFSLARNKHLRGEASFSIQTWGRSVRIETDGDAILSFVILGESQEEHRTIVRRIPVGSIDFDGRMPEGWPYFHT